MCNTEGYRSENPYSQEADLMCNTLLKEVMHARTWDAIRNAIAAIRSIRSDEKTHASEWEHLNNPGPIGIGACRKGDSAS